MDHRLQQLPKSNRSAISEPPEMKQNKTTSRPRAGHYSVNGYDMYARVATIEKARPSQNLHPTRHVVQARNSFAEPLRFCQSYRARSSQVSSTHSASVPLPSLLAQSESPTTPTMTATKNLHPTKRFLCAMRSKFWLYSRSPASKASRSRSVPIPASSRVANAFSAWY